LVLGVCKIQNINFINNQRCLCFNCIHVTVWTYCMFKISHSLHLCRAGSGST